MKQIMVIGVLLLSLACANRKERIQEREAHDNESSEAVDIVTEQ